MTSKNKGEAILSKYREELLEDAKFERSTLASHIAMNTSIQAKWLNYYSRFKESYITRNKKLKELKAKKFIEAISGTSGFAVTKREAGVIVAGDKDIVDLEEEIEIIETALDFFADAQKVIRDKGFAMSNLIKLEEFEAGVR